MNNTITTSINIPVVNIINDSLMSNPRTECEFNNLMMFNVLYIFVKLLLIHGDINETEELKGGYKKASKKINKYHYFGATKKYKRFLKQIKKNETKTKRTTKKTRNSKTTNSKTKNSKTTNCKTTNTKKHIMTLQHGGLPPNYMMFFVMLLLFSGVFGIKNVTDTDIVNRLITANDVSKIFRNQYGTCTANTLLFLKTIDLITFEELSIKIHNQKRGLRNNEIKQYLTENLETEDYLNKDLNIKVEWNTITHFLGEGSIDDNINEYINDIMDVLKQERNKLYGTDKKQNIITILNYSVEEKNKGHSVVVWLNSRDDIFIIDPQNFNYYGFEIYTTLNIYDDTSNYIKNILPSNLKLRSLKRYIKENVNFKSDNYRITYILTSVHGELTDNPLTNKKLVYETIQNIERATQNYNINYGNDYNNDL